MMSGAQMFYFDMGRWHIFVPGNGAWIKRTEVAAMQSSSNLLYWFALLSLKKFP